MKKKKQTTIEKFITWDYTYPINFFFFFFFPKVFKWEKRIVINRDKLWGERSSKSSCKHVAPSCSLLSVFYRRDALCSCSSWQFQCSWYHGVTAHSQLLPTLAGGDVQNNPCGLLSTEDVNGLLPLLLYHASSFTDH